MLGRPAGLRVPKGRAAPLAWPQWEMTSPPRAAPDDPIKIAQPVSAPGRYPGFFGRLTAVRRPAAGEPSGKQRYLE